jgi:hypothetical protein
MTILLSQFFGRVSVSTLRPQPAAGFTGSMQT